MEFLKVCSLGLMLLALNAGAQNFAKQDEKSGLYGIANADGDYIVKPKYKEVDFDFGNKPGLAFVVDKNGKYGFINPDGKESVPCKYDYAGHFDNGYAIVYNKTGQYDQINGLIDSTGKETIPLKYGHLEYYPDDRVLVAGQTSSSDVGLLDVNGKVLIPFQYEFWSKRVSHGLWPVGKNDICGVVNLRNEVVVPFAYTMIESYEDKDGVAAAKKEAKGKYGFIDRAGKEVVPFVYEEGWPAGNGYLAAKKDGKWGLIDMHNKVILPFEYFNVSSAGKKTAWVSREGEDLFEIDLVTRQKVNN